jgi:hypothetical protein
VLDRPDLTRWIDAYERAWRSPGTDGLDALFAPTARYLASPWAEPIVGLDGIGRFWDASRTPGEEFTMHREVVAVDGDRAVVRVAVDYADGQRWRDLWILELDAEGRCTHFEEWPFAPGQADGHEDDTTP